MMDALEHKMSFCGKENLDLWEGIIPSDFVEPNNPRSKHRKNEQVYHRLPQTGFFLPTNSRKAQKSPELLSETTSVCPDCLNAVPARYVYREDGVYFEKECPVHGAFSTIVWRGSRQSYESWLADAGPRPTARPSGPHRPAHAGCPRDCGLCGSHLAETCTAALMVTDRCNMNCRFCFTRSAPQDARPDPTLDQLRARLEFYRDTSGGCFPLELCGGEPTVRHDLPEIAAMARDLGFGHIQLNSNGIRLAADPQLAQQLKQAGVTVVYLGYDAVASEPHDRLREGSLLAMKESAVENCGRADLAVVLVPTLVPGVNDHALGDVIRRAVEWMPIVKGVNIQPAGYLGKYHAVGVCRFETKDSTAESGRRSRSDADAADIAEAKALRHEGHVSNASREEDAYRLTIPDVIDMLQQQTDNLMRAEHFAPPAVEHALCSFQALYLKDARGNLKSLSARTARTGNEDAAARNRKLAAQQWRSNDLFQTLTVGGMLIQDAWTYDVERARHCPMHIIGDGALYPLCTKYLTARDGTRLHPGIA